MHLLSMIIKMSAVTLLYIMLTAMVWYFSRKRDIGIGAKIKIGIIYGLSAILSTHFGISYENMIINIRDMGPLAAGLFFSPEAGIIAGLIGGIERYIAGTYFGVGTYTSVACSVSTCLAGFVAMWMNTKVFKGRRPSPVYAFFMGAVMEVFHMYVVFITHRSDLRMAFLVVSTCSIPMIFFTGLGMFLSSLILQIFEKEYTNPFAKKDPETVTISQKFQRYLFAVVFLITVSSFVFSFFLQTGSSYQNSCATLEKSADHILTRYLEGEKDLTPENDVTYDFIQRSGIIINGTHVGISVDPDEIKRCLENEGTTFAGTYFGEESLIRAIKVDSGHILVVSLTNEEVYWYRNAMAYETGLSDILLFTISYVIIAFLVDQIVVHNIQDINDSLARITDGDLEEVVDVRASVEFASLSDDINETVVALKGYIEAAEKRIEQELILARTIQDSSLPKTFVFPDRDEFEVYATMKPAKEVGGDFYDFFFADRERFALVIADVSGKGIPASLFMMRSKTAIRSFAEEGGTPEEILYKANNALCEGNDAEMFVTVWIGIIDLTTGVMKCANAGHEYPAIQRRGGSFELFKEKHSLALAAIPNLKVIGYEIKLEPGDRIFVYSDGIPESINKAVQQYGNDRMIDALNESKDKSVREILPAISESVNDFKGPAEQFDDMTMLGFEFKKYSGITMNG